MITVMSPRWFLVAGWMVISAAPLLAADAPGTRTLHVPPDLFAAGGPLGSLDIESSRIVLADGPNGSLLAVSPAMAALGFRDIAFTVPPLEREVAFGPLSMTLRLRITGRDTADPATTIQSTRLSARVAGASVALTAVFERLGPEMVGEYYTLDPRSGKAAWVRALDVDADDLTIAVSFPLQAQGVELTLGAPRVTADFSFGVSATGLASVALDGTFAKEMAKAAIERGVADALRLDAYRAPLAAALTTWLREGPFRDLQLREIRLQPAADGGLDLLGITTAAP
jgi:hypothetical protein